MSKAVYPLGQPLTLDVMRERLSLYGQSLRAVRSYREPDATKDLHILVKDNYGLEGFTTPAGAYALRDLSIPDAFCVKLLKSRGIDVFGKTNMTELAGFVTTKNPGKGFSYIGGFGINPHGDEFLCGSSSSGSGIAVAAGLCDAALGTETRGSLMKPGLFCGVWSLKPSRGLISRTRIVPLSSSFDTPGVLARDVKTLRRVFVAAVGVDPEDPATKEAVGIDLKDKGLPSQGLYKIGILRFTGDKLNAEAMSLFARYALQARRFGIEFEFIDSPCPVFDYKLISSIDIMADMDKFLGQYATGDTPKNFKELAYIYETHSEVCPYGMDRIVDALAMSIPSPNEYRETIRKNITLARETIKSTLLNHHCDALARFEYADWWAISGAPSLSVPFGTKTNGEPVGFMLGTAYGEDAKLLQLGESLEKVLHSTEF